jgi:hypothetical protein
MASGTIAGNTEDGIGKYRWKSGNEYEGNWQNGKQHGRGVRTWPSGSNYDGDFLHDKIHGQGVFTWANGNSYNGKFQDGKKNGPGVFTWKSGSKYDGAYKDDKRHGKCVYTFADGNQYEGEYKDDKKHGPGVFTFADGAFWDGMWHDAEPSGVGEWHFPGGLQVDGEGPVKVERDQTTAPAKWHAAADPKEQRRRVAEREPPAQLVNQRIEIDGRGACFVAAIKKVPFSSTKHQVTYDDGRTETLKLKRKANGGLTFVLLDGGAAAGLSDATIAKALATLQRAEGAGGGAGADMLLSRFAADAKMLRTGEVEEGANGIWLALGIEEGGDQCIAIQREGCTEIEREFRKGGQDDPAWMAEAGKHDGLGSDWARFEYVRTKRAKTLVQDNGAGRDDGDNSGKDLGDFMKHPHAGMLKQAHVLALRLYTSNSFPRINDPLRKGVKPHPFAATTYYIHDALRKLRSLRKGEATAGKTFWRGMSNVGVGEGFLRQGGTEMAPMSTTEDESVARGFAQVGKGANPLLLKVEAGNMYDCGADIQWLSMYPAEKEVLFPPLTYMKATHIQGAAVGTLPPDCTIITVTPRF